MTTKTPRKAYNQEFKDAALKLAKTKSLSVKKSLSYDKIAPNVAI